jgi:gliding motility-associated-like protein
MKNTFFCLLLLVLCFGKVVNGQNLVMNPSFENTTGTCSGLTAGEGYSQVVNWDNANSNTPGDSCSSPDLFSPCNVLPIVGGPAPTFAPNNMLGTQCPKSGTRYAGIITNEMGAGLGQSYREYIQGTLSSPLQAGQTYCVSFYIGLGDDVTFSTNNIGVFFSNTHYLRDACAQGSLINEAPHLNYDCQVVAETNQWIRLQWNYVATGGESYFMIGNFFNDANTNIQSTGVTSLNPYAYYYIDDVSIVLGACNFAEIITTGANGCGGQTDPNAPAFTFCINDPAENLIAQEGVTCPITTPSGTWTGSGITNTATGTFNPSVAGVGTHTITYTTQGGFVATTQVLVSDCQAIVVCQESNGSLTVSAGTAPYTWQNETTVQDCSACMFGCNLPPGCAVNVTQWQNFTTGATIPAPSQYPIRVIDAAGTILVINNASSLPSCSADPCASTTITINITPTNASCTNPTSGSATASASGGTGPYNYSWNTTPSQAGPTASGLSSGNYTVTVTDANNCTGTQSVTITQPSGFTVSVAGSNPTCNGGTGSATASITSGGTAPFNFVWSPSGGSNATANNLAPGPYTVNVTDASGCTSQGTVQITEPTSMTLTMSSTPASCSSNNGSASVSVTGGTGSYTYSWSPSGGSGPTTTPVGMGTYTVTVTDGANCTAQNTVQVTEASGMVLTMNSSPTQCTTNTGTASVMVSGGSGSYEYSWAPSGGTNATTTPVGQGTYTVTVTDQTSGCQAQDNVVVGVVNSPTISVINSQNVTCNGLGNGSAQVQATGGTTPYTFTWSPSGVTGASVTNLAPGTHTVTVTDYAGCKDQTQIIITQPTPFVVTDTVITHATCGFDDGSISITASGGTLGYSYNWTPSVSTSNSASNLASGTYDVVVSDAMGCSVNLSLDVNAGTFFIDAYPETSVIDLGGSVNLNVYVDPTVTVDTFFWTPTNGLSCTTCLNPVASPTETTSYIISVISDNGCIATDTVTIVVIQPCGEVFVPNIFSPNGDGLNDLECVMGDCVTSVDFKIYNRWGETVFSSDSQANCWDGTFRGKPVQTGVYVYKLTATLNTGEQILKSGNINVTR